MLLFGVWYFPCFCHQMRYMEGEVGQKLNPPIRQLLVESWSKYRLPLQSHHSSPENPLRNASNSRCWCGFCSAVWSVGGEGCWRWVHGEYPYPGGSGALLIPYGVTPHPPAHPHYTSRGETNQHTSGNWEATLHHIAPIAIISCILRQYCCAILQCHSPHPSPSSWPTQSNHSPHPLIHLPQFISPPLDHIDHIVFCSVFKKRHQI